MKVKAKYPTHIQEICYSLGSGSAILADITTEQIFDVQKGGKYYFLSRKHLWFRIRLTEKAFNDNFEIVSEV